MLGLVGILVLIAIRLRNRPGRPRGLSRFTGSTMWQGYFVEWVILAVLVCGFLIRGFKVATDHFEYPAWAAPVTPRARRGAAGLRRPAVSVVAAGQDRRLDGLG